LTDQPVSEAQERVLDIAERLFMERGYQAVKLKHIADALDIKQASLYYHFPGGKESLFVAVVQRTFHRHRAGLEDALAQATGSWEEQMRSVAYWFLSQPPMDLLRMVNSDLTAIDKQTADQLMWEAFKVFIYPIQMLFNRVNDDETIREEDSGLMAGMFISVVTGIHQLKDEWSEMTKEEMVDRVIDIMIWGMKKR